MISYFQSDLQILDIHILHVYLQSFPKCSWAQLPLRWNWTLNPLKDFAESQITLFFFPDLCMLSPSNISQRKSDPPIKICCPSTCNTTQKSQHSSLSILQRIREEINQLLSSLSVALMDSEESVI